MCNRPYQYEHLQTEFYTRLGQRTTVDLGLYNLLSMLNLLGVNTQFSCQGGMFPAYVVADRKSFAPVVKAMREHLRLGAYSPIASRFVHNLFAGTPEIWLYPHFRGVSYPQRFQRVVNPNEGFEREYTWTREFGLRTVLRWPKELTDDFLMVLEQTEL